MAMGLCHIRPTGPNPVAQVKRRVVRPQPRVYLYTSNTPRSISLHFKSKLLLPIIEVLSLGCSIISTYDRLDNHRPELSSARHRLADHFMSHHAASASRLRDCRE